MNQSSSWVTEEFETLGHLICYINTLRTGWMSGLKSAEKRRFLPQAFKMEIECLACEEKTVIGFCASCTFIHYFSFHFCAFSVLFIICLYSWLPVWWYEQTVNPQKMLNNALLSFYFGVNNNTLKHIKVFIMQNWEIIAIYIPQVNMIRLLVLIDFQHLMTIFPFLTAFFFCCCNFLTVNYQKNIQIELKKNKKQERILKTVVHVSEL